MHWRRARSGLVAVLLAMASLTLLSSLASAERHLAPPATEDELLFNYAKGDLTIIRAQHELALGYLRHALALIDAAPDAAALVRANHLSDQAYRLMRYAWHGLRLLEQRRGRALANPIYSIVADLNDQSRLSIRNARLRLAQAAKWTHNNSRDIEVARDLLRHALTLAEESQLLL